MRMYEKWIFLLALLWVGIFIGKRVSCHKVPDEYKAMEPLIPSNAYQWVGSVGTLKELKPGRAVIQFYWRLPWGEELISTPVYLYGRVVAKEGDTLEIRQGKVLVNGEILDIPEVSELAEQDEMPPILIPRGCVYVLADRRGHPLSYQWDSRMLGPIPYVLITGRVK